MWSKPIQHMSKSETSVENPTGIEKNIQKKDEQMAKGACSSGTVAPKEESVLQAGTPSC